MTGWAFGITEVAIGVVLIYLTFTGYSRDVWDILFQPDHASHQTHPVVLPGGPTPGGGGGSFGSTSP